VIQPDSCVPAEPSQSSAFIGRAKMLLKLPRRLRPVCFGDPLLFPSRHSPPLRRRLKIELPSSTPSEKSTRNSTFPFPTKACDPFSLFCVLDPMAPTRMIPFFPLYFFLDPVGPGHSPASAKSVLLIKSVCGGLPPGLWLWVMPAYNLSCAITPFFRPPSLEIPRDP